MADTTADHRPREEETEEERLIRLREEEMERLLLENEETQNQQEEENEDNENVPLLDGLNNIDDNRQEPLQNDGARDFAPPADPGMSANVGGLRNKISYTQSSFVAALATLIYALRTRGQWYLALVYLSSSKWAFCVLGNALVAAAVQVFSYTTQFFLQGGLRLHEAEGLQDFFRWNVTETCLALTMFRSELTVGTACEFLCLILAKCLHHVAVMRQNHLRMTDDAVVPSSWNPKIPTIPWNHVRVFVFLVLLQLIDMWALQYTAQILMTTGPSVSILFAFEAAILLVSSWSHLLLWNLHVVDGLLHFVHDLGSEWGRTCLHVWKEHKATLTFAVELQSQAVQFLFYLCFFGFVLTSYGVPINLFREVYVSFAALKERLVAFFKYRKLMAGMNKFKNPPDEQIEEAGRVCIICRDDMTVHDCKQLPGCGHLFHKSCLREWLTQQQTCPTCRSDIAAMQRQENTRNAAAQAADEREEAETDQEGNNETPGQAEQPAENENGEQALLSRDDNDSQANDVDASTSAPDDDAKARDNSASILSPANNQESEPTGKFGVSSSDISAPTTSRTESHRRANHTYDAESSELSSSPQQLEKGKAVRFAESVTANGLQPITFPALYRVVRGTGATIWRLDENTTSATAIRALPLGTIVLGQAQTMIYLGTQDLSVAVKVPDGWINDDEILRVHAV